MGAEGDRRWGSTVAEGSRRCRVPLGGGEVAILVLYSLVEDKGEVGGLPGKVWREGVHTGDDHRVAALSGLCHAEISMVQSVPKAASTCLSSYTTPN